MWNKFLHNPLHIVKDYELRKLLWQSGGGTAVCKKYLKFRDTAPEKLTFPETQVDEPIWLFWNTGLGKEVEITFCDVQRTKKKYKFTDEERLSFVLFGILYASRCNNFHGNVAARMNSINANKDTFKMYTDMFLTEYIILAIHLNSQGALPDMVLNKVKENANLMV